MLACRSTSSMARLLREIVNEQEHAALWLLRSSSHLKPSSRTARGDGRRRERTNDGHVIVVAVRHPRAQDQSRFEQLSADVS